MSAAVQDLESLEEGLYRSMFDDGLFDTLVGLGVLGMGLVWLSEASAFGGLLPALLVPFWAPLRRRLIEPRVGKAEFRPARRSLERGKQILLILLGVLTLCVGVALYFKVRSADANIEQFLKTFVPGLPAALLGVGAWIIAALYGLRRYFGYGAALFAAGVTVALAGLEPGVALSVGGAFPLLVGAVVLARFLRRHPVLPAELP